MATECRDDLLSTAKAPLPLLLFVSGQNTNSMSAYGNIELALEMYGKEKFSLEVIDVWVDPDRALDCRVLITPTLIAPSHARRIVGPLNNWIDVNGFLRSICESTTLHEQPARVGVSGNGKSDVGAVKREAVALRTSRELYRQVGERAPVGLALISLDGNLIHVNPALCKVSGYSAGELLAMRYQQLLHSEDMEAVLATLSQAHFETDSLNAEQEARFVRKDGDAEWVSITTSLVRNDQGAALYFIAQIQNINRRKIADETAEFERKLASAECAAKSRFLATMSHEMRTPMNGIIGNLELIALSALDTKQSECIEVLRACSESLLRLLNDILDYSKIEAGKLTLESEDFLLRDQIDAVVAILRPQATAKKITLTVQSAAADDIMLKGDAGRVRQILFNLVGNAVKFTPQGGAVCVSLASERTAASELTFRFTVEDSGPGIAPGLENRLFQPFSQLDDSTTREFGGTGLGLAISKQLVDLMGGSIGFDSSSSGASFWFAISLPPGKKVFKEIAPRMPAAWAAVAKRRSEKLLLAEDNEVNAMLAAKQFERLGFVVKRVSNGSDAVQALKDEDFDIVFMDCSMPVMDGLEATKHIRGLRSGARVPIVALTANVLAENRQSCFEAGMDDYIAKPTTLSGLHSMLERWLPEKSRAVGN